MRRAYPPLQILAVVSIATILAACGDGAVRPDRGPTVAATTTQLADLAGAVAGKRAGVEQVLAPSSDPHAYEPRPSDVRSVAGAQLVLRSGGDVDDWLADVLRNAGSQARTLTILDTLPRKRVVGGAVDPHWWQDPRNGARAVETIRDAMTAADPGGRAAYAANAARYLTALRALDRAIARCWARVPARSRRLVTDHDALGYYADRYAIDIVGTVIPANSTQAQASAGEVVRLVRTIRAADVAAIFPETSVTAKLTRAIAADAGARVGAALYADTLGPSGSAAATYLGSLRANTLALVGGLTRGRVRCQLP